MKRKFNIKPYTEENLLKDKEIFKKINFTGTQPSPEDSRDFVACVTIAEKVFPKEYLSPITEVLDQESIGSCVAHACATALAQGEELQIKAHNEYSRGYIYGNRDKADTQKEGMIIRQALKQLNKCGDVLQIDFPYNEKYPKVKVLIEKEKENLAKKALPHAIIDYYRCYSEDQIKETIMKAGCVIVCVPVYSDFGRDLHKTVTNKLSGYHAMVIVGWTKEGKWVVQNSWGKHWGYNGKLLMDADYPVNEYWGITVRLPEDIQPKPKESIFKKIIDFLIKVWQKLFKK